MTRDPNRLLDLLPALYRLRDIELAGRSGGLLPAADGAELASLEGQLSTLDAVQLARLTELRGLAERGPLAALLAILDEQLRVVEDDLDALYDDQFVETAAPWAVAYIGDLIGYRSVHGKAPGLSARAEVGHTIAFRRRKGTASMLEQLARDVTGWEARVVESFALLATTQYMNHIRPANRVTPDVRSGETRELAGTAFDAIPRTLDVRSMGGGRGRHNLPNIGIFLWRLRALGQTRVPVTADTTDPTNRQFRLDPLGTDIALWTLPQREDVIEHLAEPMNVPFPISRRRLDTDLATAQPELYGDGLSVSVYLNGVLQAPAALAVCHLGDLVAGGWAHDAPAGRIAIDPELGRLVVAADLLPLPGPIAVSFHRGGPDGVGGGDYDRFASFAAPAAQVLVRVPDDVATIQGAIDAVTAQGGGVVEVRDSRRYAETLAVDLPADATLEIRAANQVRPLVDLSAPWTVRGATGSRLTLNGLLVAGDRIVVRGSTNRLGALTIAHCSLVPGRRLTPRGEPVAPGASSVAVSVPGVDLTICASLVGSLRVHNGSSAQIDGSVVDAGLGGNAYGASDTTPTEPGGALTIESSTVLGDLSVDRIDASNSLLVGSVQAVRTQDGCLRFCYLGPGSVTPRRYRCQPELGPGTAQVPHFASLRFNAPSYARLADGTPDGIVQGSEDESEMGVNRRRYEPQRHADLRIRLDEYLRVGLEAGVIHES
ncbi:MAG TPA: hypothetical protein VJ850_08305 [Candidatus Limnocylindrales bacterium]|nr:hypothetical protein [Candidatus Limnocylindrales bacterium]